jgi:hypothetical protein
MEGEKGSCGGVAVCVNTASPKRNATVWRWKRCWLAMIVMRARRGNVAPRVIFVSALFDKMDDEGICGRFGPRRWIDRRISAR